MQLVSGFSQERPVFPFLTFRSCSVLTSLHPPRLSRPLCLCVLCSQVPVQRVTKYPLLLARLYKVTPSHHEGRELLKEAQHKIELHLEHMNEWLDFSPPTYMNWVRFLVGLLPDFQHGGNYARKCGWLASFLWVLLLPPSLHYVAAPNSPLFTLISSQNIHVKSHPNLSTLLSMPRSSAVEAKDLTSTKLWRRISIMNSRRSSGETDIINIKLRKVMYKTFNSVLEQLEHVLQKTLLQELGIMISIKMALDVLEWNHDEARFVMEGKLLYTNPTDNNWRRGRTIKLNPINAMLITNGKVRRHYYLQSA
ncbi:hypothetical protein PR048_032504 [Dryococelus australis]|uniref:DH domain-containing protein n=1 Tax=Dryococelus australis TaxID=614101 RepID=A0ABQ9G371_9NEOP|nr:hypothetical protein PR048_032504 [Dryococelus australis]